MRFRFEQHLLQVVRVFQEQLFEDPRPYVELSVNGSRLLYSGKPRQGIQPEEGELPPSREYLTTSGEVSRRVVSANMILNSCFSFPGLFVSGEKGF